MAAEVRGRVPRPARIVKHPARERDDVGVARSDDRFGLLEAGDQPDRDHGDTDRALHRARKRHL